MATAFASVTRRPGSAHQAIAAALRDTALGRMPAEERAWAARIEARRSELPMLIAEAGPPERDHAERLAEATEAARWMSVPPVWGRFLMRLVRELAPHSCLELGTAFGLSAAYQAAAIELNGEGRIVTLDQEALTEIAGPRLGSLGLGDRVELIGGLIENTLATALERAAPVDYALLDADHTEEGTLIAFDAIAPHLAGDAVIVLDDINWTDGMRRAWSAIERRSGVATVALRRVGIAVVAAAAPRGAEASR
jgi:predicted O-methyltransferase YrrM